MRKAIPWLMGILLILALNPKVGFSQAPKLWDKYDRIGQETRQETEKMFQKFNESLQADTQSPAVIPAETASPAGAIQVEGLAPVNVQPWQLECPEGYDNGSYNSKSYCIKCPPNSRYASTQSACVGCPPGYAADYEKPGQLCFRCPTGFQAGYLQRESGGGNACAKCPPGYFIDWKTDPPTCRRP
jgi:hypothetical protein